MLLLETVSKKRTKKYSIMERDYRAVAQSWLDGGYDEATKQEVRALMSGDPAALEDAFYRNLEFGTGGLRGIMGAGTNRMNRYTVGMATQGLANYIRKHHPVAGTCLCISHDNRNHSREFALITADVLSANGFDVYIFDSLRPTPELSYAVRLKKAVAGVMITASHNPKEYNGYKVFWSDGGQVTSPVDKEIVAEVNRIGSPAEVRFVPGEGAGIIRTMGEDVDSAYLKDILSLTLSPESVARHNDIRIVYTPLHGTGVRLVPRALGMLGFKNVFHVPEQDVNDGDFPTVKSPNPEEPSALKMALETAERNSADIVLATDPDADRVGVAVRDGNGKMILLNGNQTASILTYYILTRWKELGKLSCRNPYIVKTIVTTGLLKAIASDFGVRTYDVLTGFKYIAEVVKENEGRAVFVCGGEESYGFNVGEFVRDKDAVISCSMVAEAAAWAADRGKTLYGLLEEIYSKYGYYREKLLSYTMKGKSGLEKIASLMAKFRAVPLKSVGGAPVARVIDYSEPEKTGLPSSNVLQYVAEDGTVLTVRPSGTEPKIKFYIGLSERADGCSLTGAAVRADERIAAIENEVNAMVS
jgi:phosphoglucomutase